MAPWDLLAARVADLAAEGFVISPAVSISPASLGLGPCASTHLEVKPKMCVSVHPHVSWYPDSAVSRAERNRSTSYVPTWSIKPSNTLTEWFSKELINISTRSQAQITVDSFSWIFSDYVFRIPSLSHNFPLLTGYRHQLCFYLFWVRSHCRVWYWQKFLKLCKLMCSSSELRRLRIRYYTCRAAYTIFTKVCTRPSWTQISAFGEKQLSNIYQLLKTST